MSMSIKRSRLFKLLAVAALAMVMAIGTALPSFASSDDKVFFFSTEENYAKEAFISPALIKENTTSIYCWIKNSSNSKVSSVKMNARGGGGNNAEQSVELLQFFYEQWQNYAGGDELLHL